MSTDFYEKGDFEVRLQHTWQIAAIRIGCYFLLVQVLEGTSIADG